MRGIHESRGIAAVLPAGTLDWLLTPSPDSLAVFQPSTVQQLIAFGDYFRAVRTLMDTYAQGGRPTPLTMAWLVAHAEAAVRSVPELKRSLEREGGVYTPTPFPGLPVMKAGDTEPPALPPSPFPSG